MSQLVQTQAHTGLDQAGRFLPQDACEEVHRRVPDFYRVMVLTSPLQMALRIERRCRDPFLREAKGPRLVIVNLRETEQ